MAVVYMSIFSDGNVNLDGEWITVDLHSDPETEAIRRIAEKASHNGGRSIVNLTEPDGEKSHHQVNASNEIEYLGQGHYTPTVQEAPAEPAEEQEPVDLDEIDSLEFQPAPQESRIASRDAAWNSLAGADGSIPDDETIRKERRQQDIRRRRWNIGLFSVIGLLLIIVFGVLFLTPSSNLSPEAEEIAEQQNEFALTYNDEIGNEEVPGYDMTSSAWSIDVGESSAVVAYDTGVVEIAPYTVIIYDSSTGEEVTEVEIDEPGVDFLVETEVTDIPSLVWRVEDDLFVWNEELEADDGPIQLDLDGRTVNDAGTGIMAYEDTDEDGTPDVFYALGQSGFQEIDLVEGEGAPTAYDQQQVIYTSWSGEILRASTDGDVDAEIQLAAPEEEMEISSWVAVGHDRAIVAWSDEDDRTLLAMHDLQNGNVMESAEISEAALDGNSWVKGQGLQLGMFGNLVFDMESGKLIADGGDANITPDYARGQFTLTARENDSVMTMGREAWSTQLTISGAMQNGMLVVRTSPGEVQSFYDLKT